MVRTYMGKLASGYVFAGMELRVLHPLAYFMWSWGLPATSLSEKGIIMKDVGKNHKGQGTKVCQYILALATVLLSV